MAGLAMPCFCRCYWFHLLFVRLRMPWSTVQAVLKKVAALGDYSYQALVNGYEVGTVSVAQSGSGYLVTVVDA
ncbi:MAG: hypothetical protein IPP17_30300, partial [Bacteroidetes bacterium]|nr:hypothetical protein [Bacteroidota bacterium]